MKKTNLYARLLLTVTFLTFIGSAQAQRILEGTIKDPQQNSIPYCSIGIKNSRVATVANENGFFKLVVPDSLASSHIIFSAIGFFDRQIPQKELKLGAIVELKEKVFSINEVVIKGAKLKEKTVG